MIEVQGLTKYFGARPAIIDLTFSVPHGQVLGFLGPHGAGKSTTMRILAGCLGATSGTASIAGYDVLQHARQARRQVGCVPQGKLVADDAPVKLGWRLSGKHNREVAAVIVGDTPAVDQRLRKLAGVIEVTMTSSVDEERHLSVIGEGDDLQEAVARVIVGEGLSPRSLNSHNLSLGDEYRELSSEEAS